MKLCKKISFKIAKQIIKDKNLIVNDKAIYYALKEDDEILSIISVQARNGKVKFKANYTPEDKRGKGYFTELLREMIYKYRFCTIQANCLESSVKVYVNNGFNIYNEKQFKNFKIYYVKREPDMEITEVKDFIKRQNFVFAKSMPTTPHEYICKNNLSDTDKKIFEDVVMYIRQNGITASFTSKLKDGRLFTKKYIYLLIGNWYYWTMGAGLDVTIILNRANKDIYYIDDNGEMKINIKSQ